MLKDNSRHVVVGLLKKCWESFAGCLARVKFIKNELGGPGVKELDARISAPVLSILLAAFISLGCCVWVV